MKITINVRPAITDHAGQITEYVFANNVFLGVLVYRPEGFTYAGWASFTPALDLAVVRRDHTAADREFVLNALTGYAVSVVKAAQAQGIAIEEPTDEEFYGTHREYEISR